MAQQTILVCQNTACRRMGSAKVLAAFQASLANGPANSPASSSVNLLAAIPGDDGSAADVSPAQLPPDSLPNSAPDSVIDITVSGCHCLGQCGNGPMVLVLPEQIWYHRIHPDVVPALVWHLESGTHLTQLLYPRFHPA